MGQFILTGVSVFGNRFFDRKVGHNLQKMSRSRLKDAINKARKRAREVGVEDFMLQFQYVTPTSSVVVHTQIKRKALRRYTILENKAVSKVFIEEDID